MDVTNASPQRLKLAIERFEAGEALTYEGIVVYRDKERALQVSSYSASTEDSSTPEIAKEGIARAKVVLAALVELSPEVRAVAERLPHEHFFCYDYGTGAVVLAKERGGTFEWVWKDSTRAP